MGAPRDVEGGEPLQHVRAAAGRRDAGRRRRARSTGRPTTPGVRRTRTGWRKVLKPRRTTRDRRASDAPREAGPRAADRRRRAPRSPGERRRAGSRTSRRCLPLLAATGSFASLRERLTPATGAPRPAAAGRHVGLSAGARTARRRTSPRRSPASAAASGSSGSPATPRSATGSPRSCRLARRSRPRSPCSSRGPRWPTSGASSSPTRRPPASRRSRRGGAAGPRSSSRASRRSSSTRSPRTTCRPSRASSRSGPGCDQDALLARAARPRLRADDRGRRSRRVRPARRHRRRLPAVGAAAGPDRVLRRRDRLAAGLRPDRPADGRHARGGDPPARVGVPRASRGRGRAPRRGSAARAGEAPRAARRGPRAVRGRRARRTTRAPTRALTVGDAAEVWAAQLAPSTGLDHLDPTTLLVLDEPGDDRRGRRVPVAPGRRAPRGARSRAGDLPKDWPSTYLGPRDWKRRLVARPDARADLGVGAARRRGARGARPELRRPVRLARAAAPAGARGAAIAEAVERVAARTAPGSSSPATRRRASPSCSTRPAIRRPSSTRPEAPPPGAVVARRAQPQRRLRGRPGRPRLRHRPRAVRDRPRPPAEGDAARRPARHPRAARRRATSSSTSTTASPATSGCSAAATTPTARTATTSS